MAVAAFTALALAISAAIVWRRHPPQPPVIQAAADASEEEAAVARVCSVGEDPWSLDPPRAPRTALPRSVDVTETTTVITTSSSGDEFNVTVAAGLAEGLQFGDLLVAQHAGGPVVIQLAEVEATARGTIRSKRGSLAVGTPVRFRRQQCSRAESPPVSAVVDGGPGWMEVPTEMLFAFPSTSPMDASTSVQIPPTRDVMPGNPAVVVFSDGSRSRGALDKWTMGEAFLELEGEFNDNELQGGRLFVARSSCVVVGSPTTIELPLAKSVVSSTRALGPDKTEITFAGGAARPDETAQLVIRDKIVPLAIDSVSATENTGTVALPEASVKGAIVELEAWECDVPSHWPESIRTQKGEVRHVWRAGGGAELEVYAHTFYPILVGAVASFTLTDGSTVKGTVHKLLRERDFLVTLPNTNDLASRFCMEHITEMRIDRVRCWLP